jgi:hypothetical protein
MRYGQGLRRYSSFLSILQELDLQLFLSLSRCGDVTVTDPSIVNINRYIKNAT